MFTQSLLCCSAWPKTIFGSIKPKGITDKVESLPIKTNYKTKYSLNMRCRLCDQQEESESHLLSCDEILDEQLVADVSKISLSDVWSTHNKQKVTIKTLSKIFKIRDLKYEKRKLSNQTQVNPDIASSSYALCMTLD